jgi:hypothetical protein
MFAIKMAKLGVYPIFRHSHTAKLWGRSIWLIGLVGPQCIVHTRWCPLVFLSWLVCTNLAIMPGSHQIGIFKGCTAWYAQLFFWTTRGQEWHVHQTSPESVNVGKSQFGNQIFWPCKVRTSWVLKLKESKFMVHSGPCLAMPCHPQKPRRQPGTAMSTCCGWAWRTKGPPLVLSVVTGNYLSLVNKISIDP